MSGLAKKSLSFIARHFLVITLFYAALAAVSLYYSGKLSFQSDFEALLPRSFESVKALDELTKEFGGTGYLVIDIESGDLGKTKLFAAALVKELEKLPEVRYVNWRQPKEYFEARKLLYMDLPDLETVKARIGRKIKLEKQKANPLFIDLLDEEYTLDFSDIEKKYKSADIFRDYFVSKDGRELILLIKPSGLAGNLAFSRRLLAQAEAAVARANPATYDPSIKVSYTGRFKKQIDLNDQLQRDLKYTGAGALALVIFLLVAYFRQVRPLLLILLPMAAGLLITFAAAYAAVGYLNIISAFLVSILMGISADYGIVLYSRYTEERLRGLTPGYAVAATLRNTCGPIFLSGLTTGLVFLSLTLAEFKGFSQFGFIAGLGIFLNMLVFFTLFPALILLFEKIKPAKINPSMGFNFKPVRKAFYIPVLVVAAFMTVYAVSKVRDASFEYNFTKIQGSNIPSFKLDEHVNTIIGTSLTPDLALLNDLDEARAVSRALEEKEKTPGTTIAGHASLLTFLPEEQTKKRAVLRGIRAMLDEGVLTALKGEEKQKLEEARKLLEPPPTDRNTLPKEILRLFSGDSGRPAVLIFPKIDLADTELVRKSSDEIRDIPIAGRVVHPCSESIIFADILNMIERDGRKILPLALLLTALPVIAAYRRPKPILLVLVPLCAGFLWIFGIMALFGMKFNFFSVVMLPLIFGLGDDYAEIVYGRYEEEGPGSVHFVMTHTGPAVAMSALTTFIGFGALLFAAHNGLRSIGVMAAVGIACVFGAAVMLLPSLIVMTEKLKTGNKDVQQKA
ncbi:MAG: MMPL family transporter [Elusimicrobiales bacterium]|nr:MMPL family transporter [Elusimicrobiales bacterium]